MFGHFWMLVVVRSLTIHQSIRRVVPVLTLKNSMRCGITHLIGWQLSIYLAMIVHTEMIPRLVIDPLDDRAATVLQYCLKLICMVATGIL